MNTYISNLVRTTCFWINIRQVILFWLPWVLLCVGTGLAVQPLCLILFLYKKRSCKTQM